MKAGEEGGISVVVVVHAVVVAVSETQIQNPNSKKKPKSNNSKKQQKSKAQQFHPKELPGPYNEYYNHHKNYYTNPSSPYYLFDISDEENTN